MPANFSIVIPAYNNLTLFRRALESARCQQGVTMEIIVVDDSDAERADIQQYIAALNDPRIVYCHNVPSLGAVPNWNSGLRLCTGQNIILMHHDEALQNNNVLQKTYQLLNRHEVVIGHIEVHRSDGKVYGLAPNWMKRLSLYMPSILLAVNILGPTAVVAFHSNCMQLFNEQTRWFVDVEWYYRMLRHCKSIYAPSFAVISYHGYQGQITGSIDAMDEARRDASILQNVYRNNLPIRIAIWLHINIIHNQAINRLLKTLLKR